MNNAMIIIVCATLYAAFISPWWMGALIGGAVTLAASVFWDVIVYLLNRSARRQS